VSEIKVKDLLEILKDINPEARLTVDDGVWQDSVKQVVIGKMTGMYNYKNCEKKNADIVFLSFCEGEHDWRGISEQRVKAVARLKDNWVSVDDRLPKESELVFVSYIAESGREVIPAHYYVPNKTFENEFDQVAATHWQPRPDPPAGGC